MYNNNQNRSSRPKNSASHRGTRTSGATRKRSYHDTEKSDSRPKHATSAPRTHAYSRDARRPSFTHRPSSPVNRTSRGRVLKTFDVSKYINKNPVAQSAPEVYKPEHTFTEFGLDQVVVRTVLESGITTPTPIQDQIIPHILQNRDVIGLANTGTGKTAAFLIPLIDKTLKEYKRQTLILTPTRELALQIEAELKKLSKHSKLYATVCVGGTHIRPQIQGLRRKNHFIIGTPGRVIDLLERGNFIPQNITTVVLDEADRMLDMGFIHDMRKILENTPRERETLFFSATMSDDIKRLVHDFLNDPITVSVKKQDAAEGIEQDVIRYEHHNKFETLTNLLAQDEFKRVLVFGAMKHSVEKLATQLVAHGIQADSIHGNKSHSQRQRALLRFKNGQARVLVATDVAARGIHVDNISHVVNYDLPSTYEDYIHRIGRTGRGTLRGKALTFVQ